MLSLEQIRDDQLQAAARAARAGKVPLVSWPEDNAIRLAENMPYLGDYLPAGWRLDETYFVDSSGWGREDEPALTIDQFDVVVQEHVGAGWAVTEAGQFQVVVGRFEKTAEHPTKRRQDRTDPFYPVGEDW